MSDMGEFCGDKRDGQATRFPHWHSFIIDAWPLHDDSNLFEKSVSPWLLANAVFAQDYVTTSDPAGFSVAVRFADKALYDRFMAEFDLTPDNRD